MIICLTWIQIIDRDMGHRHFLKSTCDMRTPVEGPSLVRWVLSSPTLEAWFPGKNTQTPQFVFTDCFFGKCQPETTLDSWRSGVKNTSARWRFVWINIVELASSDAWLRLVLL